jgi:CheY-like chemotaxis protein
MMQKIPPLKLASHKLTDPRSMQAIVRVLLIGGWLAALGLMKTQGHTPVIYFLPLLSLVSLFLLDLFAGVVCALLTSGLVFLSPAVTNEAQFALLSLLWASLLLIVAFRHNPAEANTTTTKVSPTLEGVASPAKLSTRVIHDLRTPLNLILGFSEQMLRPVNRVREPLSATYQSDVEAIERNARILQTTLEALISGSSSQPDRRLTSHKRIDRTMIVCDDNRKVINFFAQHLSDWRVIGAPDRAALLSLGTEHHPHAVVITSEDIRVTPDEVMRKFGMDTAVITCPVASLDRVLRRYSRVEHLVKPVTYDVLKATLTRLNVQPASVLVLDDNHDIVQMFSQMILSLAPSAMLWKAYSGQEGLALLSEQAADLMIIDFKLPDTSGLDLIPQIRAMPAYRAVPILLISGVSDHEVVQQSSSALTVYEAAGTSPEAMIRRIEALVTTDMP